MSHKCCVYCQECYTCLDTAADYTYGMLLEGCFKCKQLICWKSTCSDWINPNRFILHCNKCAPPPPPPPQDKDDDGDDDENWLDILCDDGKHFSKWAEIKKKEEDLRLNIKLMPPMALSEPRLTSMIEQEEERCKCKIENPTFEHKGYNARVVCLNCEKPISEWTTDEAVKEALEE